MESPPTAPPTERLRGIYPPPERLPHGPDDLAPDDLPPDAFDLGPNEERTFSVRCRIDLDRGTVSVTSAVTGARVESNAEGFYMDGGVIKITAGTEGAKGTVVYMRGPQKRY